MNGSTVGPALVPAFQASVISHALELYARTGMKVNRAYTPAAMMRAACAITGKTFKPRDYLGAAAALRAQADHLAAQGRAQEAAQAAAFQVAQEAAQGAPEVAP